MYVIKMGIQHLHSYLLIYRTTPLTFGSYISAPKHVFWYLQLGIKIQTVAIIFAFWISYIFLLQCIFFHVIRSLANKKVAKNWLTELLSRMCVLMCSLSNAVTSHYSAIVFLEKLIWLFREKMTIVIEFNLKVRICFKTWDEKIV